MFIPHLVVAFILGAAGLSAQDHAARPETVDDWPMHRGDHLNTGVSRSATDALKGKIKWRFTGGNRLTQSPVIADGVAYIGDWNSVMYAIDTKTGKPIWNSKPRVSKAEKPGAAPPVEAGDLSTVGKRSEQFYSFSNPVVDGDGVFACTQQGILTRFNRADGKVVWERELGVEVYSSPRVFEGKLLFGTKDGRFLGIDVATGKTLWTYLAADTVGSSCAILKSGTVIFPSHDKFLHFVDSRTGKGKKKYEIGYRSTGSPLVAFGCVYFCATGRNFMCVDLLDGRIRWRQDSTTQHQQGVGVWGKQVMVHIQRFLFAYDAVTGREIWRLGLDGQGAVSPCVGKKYVYISDDTGTVYAADLATGEIRWRVTCADKSWSCPILVDGIVYYADGSGNLTAIE